MPTDISVVSIPLSRITLDPADNYRWKSAEAMKADLEKEEAVDPESGVAVNKFSALVEAIRADGVNTPITVQKAGDLFKVMVGFHRFLAAKEAGLKTIPACVAEEGDDLSIKQVVENSQDLRRNVPWTVEADAWKKIFEKEHARFKLVLPSKRRDESGRVIAPDVMAYRYVAQRLGVPVDKVRSRIRLLGELPARVAEQASISHWSPSVCKEFLYDSHGVRLADDFVDKMLDEIQRSDSTFSRTTARTVQNARARVADWIAKGKYKASKVVWRADEKSDGPAPVDNVAPITPGAVRTLAANFAARWISAKKLTLSSPEAAWEEARKSRGWSIICGMGIGTNDALLPVGSDSMVDDVSFPDFDARTNYYACTAFVTAILRSELKARSLRPWAVWYNESTEKGAASKANRLAFQASVRAGVDSGSTLKSMALAAWESLSASGCMPALRPAAVLKATA